MAAMITATPTPAPIPAFAAVERPDELPSSELSSESAVPFESPVFSSGVDPLVPVGDGEGEGDDDY